MGTVGDELIARLDRAQRAVAAGDRQAATQNLFAMQKTLLQAMRTGAINRAFARQALGGIEGVARWTSDIAALGAD